MIEPNVEKINNEDFNKLISEARPIVPLKPIVSIKNTSCKYFFNRSW